MKLVVDLQGAQSASRRRGIGRYSLALAAAMARRADGHEIWIALNAALIDTIEELRAAFDALMPQERIVVWEAPTPAAEADPANEWRRRTGEILRESFLASLKPDMVHASSLFEGLSDDAVTSVGTFVNGRGTAVTLYDLIPLIYHDAYLANPTAEAWYLRKVASMRRAGLWLAISESSRREGIDWLDLPPDKVINISAAADARFRPLRLNECAIQALRQRYGLTRQFVMYTGGIDPRKNIEGLISAYARLPATVRKAHQLAVVCSAQEDSIAALMRHAKRQGLGAEELVMTGFVSDDDLVALYNLCAAFCLPSWHEGFGLPALEAMQCGVATIGAKTSSIPEVIGRADALFDPHDQNDMAQRLHQVLIDADYRASLARHGLRQARKFSWEESARRTWVALEAHHAEIAGEARRQPSSAHDRRPRLAYVSPLPPERSGIADYSAELLPVLARHYDIDLIVAQPAVADSWARANCPIRDVAWFQRNGHQYDRILYHFGNSTFHQHMVDLLQWHPGVVVLHDFFLSGLVSHIDTDRVGFWWATLYKSHGYHAVRECCRAEDPASIVRKYPVNLPVLQNATGIIVHSDHSRRLAQRCYRDDLSNDWTVIPQLRRLPQTGTREAARKVLGFGDHDFVLCSFGFMAPTKLNHRLLQAWLMSNLPCDPNCHLVFVGKGDGAYGADIRRIIDATPAKERIRITGFASPELYGQYLWAADAAVQLRTLSRGETARTVLDCMAFALPTIVNAHGSMAELPENCVIMLPDEFADPELGATLEALRSDPARRAALGERARSYVKNQLSPRRVADKYHAAIEYFFENSRKALKGRVVEALAAVDSSHRTEHEWLSLARSLNRNIPAPGSKRQLLVDVSELIQRDGRSGSHRIARSILKELLTNPTTDYQVEPVYATLDKPGYYYARSFTLQFLDCPIELLRDEPAELQQGDIFLGLDLQHHVVLRQSSVLADMRRRGIKTYFIVYDLLPISLPQFFLDAVATLHPPWVSMLSKCADGLACISRSVADELVEWLNTNGPPRQRPLQIGWFHLGSDVEHSNPTSGLPDQVGETLVSLVNRPSFLMVGTIEPRKAYAQALDAFERLWRSGYQINLVIVGKQGWMVESLVKRLRNHSELGKRLFWLEGISDDYLEKTYAACACLIAASEGEGFGLPLIEAARHKLPILARDIPVFREVAGGHASYFRGKEPDDLANAIENWLALHAKNCHPKSDDMPWLTWAHSAERLKAVLLLGGWYTAWPSDEKAQLAREAGGMTVMQRDCLAGVDNR
jgi:glycosyltransferase involved in cell wall biosynthesis